MILLVRGADGRYVELNWDRWVHVKAKHPDIADSIWDIVLAIEHPTYREPDVIPGRQRLFRRGGPQRWIRVVIEFHGDFDRVVTVFPQVVDPRPGRQR